MSLRVHCDWCEEYVYQTARGQNKIYPQSSSARINDLVFCDEACRVKYVRYFFLNETVEVEPGLVEVQ